MQMQYSPLQTDGSRISEGEVPICGFFVIFVKFALI